MADQNCAVNNRQEILTSPHTPNVWDKNTTLGLMQKQIIFKSVVATGFKELKYFQNSTKWQPFTNTKFEIVH